jgi:acetyltransferase-like isoleucine patch superfamily enzyme
MQMIINILTRIARRVYPYRKALISSWRRFLLEYHAAWWKGKLVIGNEVCLDHPVIFQGRGRLLLEDHVTLGYQIGGAPAQPILLQPREANAVIRIGANTTIVNGTEMIARMGINIGQNCLIGARCQFLDSDFHGLRPDQRNGSGLSAAIIIEDNVWLGSSVTVLKGVIIGRDAVIGTGSIVTTNVPIGAIVVGNPGKIIGSVYDRY